MIKQEIVEESGQVKVTFVQPHDPNQCRIYVAGDFNDWNPTAHQLVKRINGTRSVSLVLESNKRYAFRYCTEDGQWFNDEAAHGYEPNSYGGENSLLNT